MEQMEVKGVECRENLQEKNGFQKMLKGYKNVSEVEKV